MIFYLIFKVQDFVQRQGSENIFMDSLAFIWDGFVFILMILWRIAKKIFTEVFNPQKMVKRLFSLDLNEATMGAVKGNQAFDEQGDRQKIDQQVQLEKQHLRQDINRKMGINDDDNM